MSKFAWVTLTTNDTYSLGALVLAHSLKRVSTAHQLAVLVTPGVSEPMRNRLKEVYNVVQEVNVLDSQDAANLALLARPELGVTFTKFYCWKLVQFEKCVFLDADILVLQNCDELFEREELSAAPDISWPDCFNSGVFVFRPSIDTFTKLIEFAVKYGSFDGGDQGLLNQYFSDWSHKDINKHLPFIYNTHAFASYSYLPAFKQFRDLIKILHFAGRFKPWLANFDSLNRIAYAPQDFQHITDFIQLWWNIYCDKVHGGLSDEMRYLPTRILGWKWEHDESTTFEKYDSTSYEHTFYDPWEDYYENLTKTNTTNETSAFVSSSSDTTPICQTVEIHYYNPSENILSPTTELSQSESNIYQSNEHRSIEQKESCYPDTFEVNSKTVVHLQEDKNEHRNFTEFRHTENISKLTGDETVNIEPYTNFETTIISIVDASDSQVNKEYVENLNDSDISINIQPIQNTAPPPSLSPSLDLNSDNTIEQKDTIKSPTNENEYEKSIQEKEIEAGLAGALSKLILGESRTPEQEAYENHIRRQCWECGNIDYCGRDSFDNIWKRITQTLESGAPKKDFQTSEKPSEPAAVQPAAEQPVGAQPAAIQPAAVQPAAEQSAAAQPAAEQPAAAQPAAEQPAATLAEQPAASQAEQPAAAQPATTQPVAVQPAAEQSAAVQPAATLPAAAIPAAAQPAAEQPPAAQPPATQPVAEQSAAVQPAATQPVAAQPAAEQPPEAQPAAAQPAAKQPATAPKKSGKTKSPQPERLTSADIEDGKVEYDSETNSTITYRKIEKGYEMYIQTPQPNGTMKTQTKTFYDPQPVTQEELERQQRTQKDAKKVTDQTVAVKDANTTVFVRKIPNGREEVYTTVNADGTKSVQVKTYYDSEEEEITETTQIEQEMPGETKIITRQKVPQQQQKQQLVRQESDTKKKQLIESNKQTKLQRVNTEERHHEEVRYKSEKTIQESRHVSQTTEVSGKSVTTKKSNVEEQSHLAITDKKDKKKKSKKVPPTPPAEFNPGQELIVTEKKIRGGIEYHYTGVNKEGKTVTSVKTVYDEEEVEMTEEEIKKYKKQLKEAEKHKNVAEGTKVKSKDGVKQVVASENPGEVTTVETVKIQGGTEYRYTTVMADGTIKKSTKTVYDPTPVEGSDEEEVVEEYEEEIIEPGESTTETFVSTKVLGTRTEIHEAKEEITTKKKGKKVKN